MRCRAQLFAAGGDVVRRRGDFFDDPAHIHDHRIDCGDHISYLILRLMLERRGQVALGDPVHGGNGLPHGADNAPGDPPRGGHADEHAKAEQSE